MPRRRVRVDYKCTPDWEYFDQRQGKPRQGLESWRCGLEVLTCPEEDNLFDIDPDEEGAEAEADDDKVEDEAEDEKPHWAEIDLSKIEILNRAVWDAIEEVIDAKCKEEDAERRRTAGI